MGNSQSRRAEIIKQILPYISANSYEDGGRYWVFGASSIWDIIDDLTASHEEREERSLKHAIIRSVGEVKLHTGRIEATGRVSLNPPPRFKSAVLDGLSAEDRSTFRKALELARQELIGAVRKPDAEIMNLAENLDAKFTEEMVGKLPKIVDRALYLDQLSDQLSLDDVPTDVKQYFEEAHHCYLYGFNIACAVLCRSILESALSERFDPQEKISAGPHGRFQTLVEIAEHKGILKPDRPSAALQVRDAGNKAIHDVEAFNKIWKEKDKFVEILDNTRKVLLELYPNLPVSGA